MGAEVKKQWVNITWTTTHLTFSYPHSKWKIIRTLISAKSWDRHEAANGTRKILENASSSCSVFMKALIGCWILISTVSPRWSILISSTVSSHQLTMLRCFHAFKASPFISFWLISWGEERKKRNWQWSTRSAVFAFLNCKSGWKNAKRSEPWSHDLLARLNHDGCHLKIICWCDEAPSLVVRSMNRTKRGDAETLRK